MCNDLRAAPPTVAGTMVSFEGAEAAPAMVEMQSPSAVFPPADDGEEEQEDGEEELPRISGGEAGASVFSRMVFQWVDPAVWEGVCCQ